MCFKKVLSGYDYDDELMFKTLIQCFGYYVNVDNFIIKILGKESSGICDGYLTVSIIKDIIYRFADLKLRGLERLLKYVDVRNPNILINYFLTSNTEYFTQFLLDEHLRLMDFVIERTKLRATKNKSYNIALEKLETAKTNIINKFKYTL
jgi:hypothetical protein